MYLIGFGLFVCFFCFRKGRVAPRPIAAPRPKKKSTTTTSSAAATADTSVRSQTVVEKLPAVAELMQSSQVQAMIASARQAELARIAAHLPTVSHDWSDAPTLTVSSSTMAAARTYTLKTLNEAHRVNQMELLLDVAQQRDTRTQANIRKRERVDRANAKVGRMPKSSKTTVYQCSDCGRILKGTQHLRRHSNFIKDIYFVFSIFNVFKKNRNLFIIFPPSIFCYF